MEMLIFNLIIWGAGLIGAVLFVFLLTLAFFPEHTEDLLKFLGFIDNN